MQEKPGGSAIFIPKFDPLALSIWRRGWDSNPRYGFPHARFRGECFQPLSHLSAVGYRLNRSRALHFSAIGRSPNVTRKSERVPSASLMINRAWRCTNRIHDSRDACGLAAFGEEGLEDRG